MPEGQEVLRSEPALGPTGLRIQFDLDNVAERLLKFAGLYTAIELMTAALNQDTCVARKSRFGEYLNEPFPDLFEVAEHAEPSPAIGTSNKYKL